VYSDGNVAFHFAILAFIRATISGFFDARFRFSAASVALL